MNAAEKRLAERINVELPIYFDDEESVTRDVSRAGIYFLSDCHFTKGRYLSFSLALDYALPGESIKMSCHGEVVRVEPHDDQYGIAAKIHDLELLN